MDRGLYSWEEVKGKNDELGKDWKISQWNCGQIPKGNGYAQAEIGWSYEKEWGILK